MKTSKTQQKQPPTKRDIEKCQSSPNTKKEKAKTTSIINIQDKMNQTQNKKIEKEQQPIKKNIGNITIRNAKQITQNQKYTIDNLPPERK